MKALDGTRPHGALRRATIGIKVLERVAKTFAIAAGLLIIAVAAISCASVIGRNSGGWSLDGDFELVSFATGAALALCLPWCQLRRGHIIVDFFSARASERVRDWMDRLGAAVMALMLAALGWRSAIGGLSAWRSQSSSMMLGAPEWIVYAFIVPGLLLSAFIAGVQALGFRYSRMNEGVAP